MSIDELTVFDIKYNEGMERLNNLLSKDYSSNFIKNYVEGYKIDKSKEKIIFQKGNNTDYNRNIKKEEKRKQIVDIHEIREHNKKFQQLINKNYLKNEIEWFKIKKREEENKNKYNYNKSKIENDLSMTRYDENKEIIRVNNLKMKKFSNLANKVNIDRIMKIKKLNQNINKDQKNKETISYNYINNIKDFNDGIFIPYSEYKQIEMNNNNKINKININQIRNYNPNKSEKINIKKINSNKNKINIKNNQNQIINKSKSVINHQITNKKNNNNNINKIQDLHFNQNRITISQGKEINNRRNAYQKKIDNINKIKGRKISKENRISKNEEKILFKDDKNILNNIEYLNFKSKKYEDKAKNQEQLMRIKGNKNYRNEDNVKLANFMIDSISTKLKILNQITSQDKNL